jgi:hypothetical protein
MSPRILLANTYSLIGNKSMSANVRMKLKESNTKRVIGCSWTVVKEKIYVSTKHLKRIFIFVLNRNFMLMIDQIHIHRKFMKNQIDY